MQNKFSDDGAAQWLQDLHWATDAAKVTSLLKHVFLRRLRLDLAQARLWKRVVDLYFRSDWSLREIGNQFGVTRENIFRVARNLRKEAARYFGPDSQPEIEQPQPKPRSKQLAPITDPDSTNTSPEYWERVLRSHGLGNPDTWQGRISVRTVNVEAIGPRERHAAEPADPHKHSGTKPSLRAKKTSATAKRIGTKAILIGGQSYEVAIFSPGVGDEKLARLRIGEYGSAAGYTWQPFIESAASGHDEVKGVLAHVATGEDVEAALAPDSDEETRAFLAAYKEIQDEKSSLPSQWRDKPVVSNLRVVPVNAPTIVCQKSEERIQPEDKHAA